MDSDTSSLLILVAIIAAAILVPLVLIGGLVLIFLPVVRRRRQAWQSAATSLGLQSDPLCMYGSRGLPVRIFWEVGGARSSSLDLGGMVLAGRNDMRGGSAGLRYTYCRALFDPPLRLGLSLAPNDGSPANIRSGYAAFDQAFSLRAREGLQAQMLFQPSVIDEFVLVAKSGWQLSANDQFVQVKLGGDYSAQFTERDPALLSAALDTVVHCGQQLLSARRALPPTASEQNIIATWDGCATQLGLKLDPAQTLLAGSYAGLQVQVYADCLGQQEWRTVFTVTSPRPFSFKLYLTRKGAGDRIWQRRGKQVIEMIQLRDPIIEQAFEVCGNHQSILDQVLSPRSHQDLQRLCLNAADVVIEDNKVETSVLGFVREARELRQILDTLTRFASAMS